DSYIDNQQLWLSVSCSEERCTEQTLQRKLSDWYLSQAQEYMGPKTLRYARQLNKSVSDIKFRRTKSKWGHCTSRGVIQYNWLIMMAPVAVIDYLIAHEVSHLVHHNHSARVWNTVEKLDPAYRQHRQWLKDQGHKFLI
ncbi:MAG: M48 family metallopeptidase, partial [Pseudomonadota bacterium]|nr:M48 family metallopeptidase [Pseudomonadota bacterium]